MTSALRRLCSIGHTAQAKVALTHQCYTSKLSRSLTVLDQQIVSQRRVLSTQVVHEHAVLEVLCVRADTIYIHVSRRMSHHSSMLDEPGQAHICITAVVKIHSCRMQIQHARPSDVLTAIDTVSAIA
eukprot:3353-Heterococcus_DN1.PRE.9